MLDTVSHVSSFLGQRVMAMWVGLNMALGESLGVRKPSSLRLAAWNMPHTGFLSLGDYNIVQKIRKCSLQKSYNMSQRPNRKELTFFLKTYKYVPLGLPLVQPPCVTRCSRTLSIAPLCFWDLKPHTTEHFSERGPNHKEK